jgi:hypothetical protein
MVLLCVCCVGNADGSWLRCFECMYGSHSWHEFELKYSSKPAAANIGQTS